MKKKTAPLAPQFLSIEVKEDDESYNGWTNYETWNIADYLSNDKGLYETVEYYVDMQETFREEIRRQPFIGPAIPCSYADFIESDSFSEWKEYQCEWATNSKTPDGVSWDNPKLNHKELDKIFHDFNK